VTCSPATLRTTSTTSLTTGVRSIPRRRFSPISKRSARSPREGARARWQPTADPRLAGRRPAFDALLATLDDPSIRVDAQAVPFDRLASSAEHVRDSLLGKDQALAPSSELAVCGFCGKRGTEVRYVIEGHDSRICDECIVVCVEILDELLGDDWRPDAANGSGRSRESGPDLWGGERRTSQPVCFLGTFTGLNVVALLAELAITMEV
jgi:ClpX C4-type zinc finger